jgi:hypothetical protein
MALDGLAASLHRIEGLQDRSELRFDLPSNGALLRPSGRPGRSLRNGTGLLGEWLLARHGAAPKRTTAG